MRTLRIPKTSMRLERGGLLMRLQLMLDEHTSLAHLFVPYSGHLRMPVVATVSVCYGCHHILRPLRLYLPLHFFCPSLFTRPHNCPDIAGRVPVVRRIQLSLRSFRTLASSNSWVHLGCHRVPLLMRKTARNDWQT